LFGSVDLPTRLYALFNPQVIDNSYYTHILPVMPHTTTLPFGPVDCSDKLNDTDNHIFMDIENLLVDWPTYTVQFTPTHPGPVVCIYFEFRAVFAYVNNTDTYIALEKRVQIQIY
jgi:hypothetical protein